MAAASENGQFAADQIAKVLERLAFQISATKQSRGPEPVHDLRVAIRRFTQALILFKPYLQTRERKKIRRRLKQMMGYAGEVRDWDIAAKLLARHRSASALELIEEIRKRRKDAEYILVADLRRWVTERSPSKWRAALLPVKAAEYDVATAAGRLAREFFADGDHAASKQSGKTLHAFRIDAKKFRYTLELLAPLYGEQAKGWIQKIKQVQTLLGDINDCRATRRLLAGLKAGAAVDASLKKRQQKKTREFTDCWKAEYAGLAEEWSTALGHAQATHA